jgi:hypothetical protein
MFCEHITYAKRTKHTNEAELVTIIRVTNRQNIILEDIVNPQGVYLGGKGVFI